MNQISVRQLHEMRQRGESIYLVDVRQPWEHERGFRLDDGLVPLDELADRSDEITPPDGALIVAYCHHGIRSINAAASITVPNPPIG